MADLLRIEDLSAGYGEAVVLGGINITVNEGKTLALLGRNGTGNRVDQRGFSRAVAAQEGQGLAFGNRQVDAVEHHRLAIAGTHVFDAQQISHAVLLHHGPDTPL